MTVPEQVRNYFKQIGAKGGAAGKRKLSSEDAKAMAALSARKRQQKARTGDSRAKKGHSK